ncbi:hypothetical protein ABZ805_24660 [Saccharopolyspora sp. NPDC047091]|uniref:hypothetical protein n=1 Tax=Saccharopolyspora sp. NPDC047091 TaxID=3155924 RepID=UPI0033D66760
MAALGRRRANRRYARELREQLGVRGETAAAAAPRSHVSFDLASADESFRFRAELTFWVRWAGSDPHHPAAVDIAAAGVMRRAEQISVRYRITECERLRAELNVELSNWYQVSSTPVYAQGHCLSVDADPEFVAAVQEQEHASRRTAVMGWQEQARARQREQMRSLILDPLRATAWWLSDHQDQPESAVNVAQKFTELRDMLRPEDSLDSPGTVLDEFLTTTDDDAVRMWTIRQLRKVFEQHQRDDLTVRLGVIEQ